MRPSDEWGANATKRKPIRPFVKAMAEAMELQLRKNDGKNGSGWDGLDAVFAKLAEEVSELMREASVYGATPNLLKEAADVANLAGMVVVYVGDLIPSYEPSEKASR